MFHVSNEAPGQSINCYGLIWFSLGTYAIVSLVVATTIKYYAGIYYPIKDSSETINESNYTSTKIWNSSGPAEPSSDYISDDPTEAKVIIGGMLALQSGLFMVIYILMP